MALLERRVLIIGLAVYVVLVLLAVFFLYRPRLKARQRNVAFEVNARGNIRPEVEAKLLVNHGWRPGSITPSSSAGCFVTQTFQAARAASNRESWLDAA